MKYTIYIKSNEHPRTVNSYTNARTYFTAIRVQTREELESKVADLRANGETITDIRTNLGTRIWL